MKNKNRFLIGCKVSEFNRNDSNLETEYLFRTINQFGGSMANAQKMACFTDTPDKNLLNLLEKLGVEIKHVKPIDERNKYSHKLRVIEEGAKFDVDYIVLLDTDIVVVDDFSKYVSGSSVRLKSGADYLTIQQWASLFDYFDLELPKERIIALSGRKTIPCFQSGVVIIPKKYAMTLFQTWKNFIHTLCDTNKNLPNNIHVFSQNYEEISLTLSLMKAKIPYEYLSLGMNYTMHHIIHDRFHPKSEDPYLLHYFHCFSNTGKIWHSQYDNVNKKIDKINEFLLKDRTFSPTEKKYPSTKTIYYLFLVKKYQEILKLLSDLPLNHENAEYQFSLAVCREVVEKKYDEALHRYGMALKNGYEPFWVHFNRGTLYLKRGEIKKAIKDLKIAHDLDPDNKDAKKRLEFVEKFPFSLLSIIKFVYPIREFFKQKSYLNNH